MTEGGLRQKIMKGTIPSFRIDGAVRFSKKAIDEWIDGLHCGGKKKTDLFYVDVNKSEL